MEEEEEEGKTASPKKEVTIKAGEEETDTKDEETTDEKMEVKPEGVGSPTEDSKGQDMKPDLQEDSKETLSSPKAPPTPAGEEEEEGEKKNEEEEEDKEQGLQMFYLFKGSCKSG